MREWRAMRPENSIVISFLVDTYTYRREAKLSV